MSRESFIFYKDWLNALNEMPENAQLEVYKSIAKYALDGEISELSPLAKIAFSFIKPQIDRDTDKYIKVVERNRENGKLGGRKPKKPKVNPKNPVGYLETQKTQANPKNLDNDNVNDNDNGNVNVYVNDKEEIENSNSLSNSDELVTDRINYKSVVDSYNSNLGGILSKVTAITEKRKAAIRARIKEHGIDSVATVFHNVSKSDFLTGKNDKGWQCGFDWIFMPNNYIKILEGNYANREPKREYNPEIGRILTDNSTKKYTKGW